VQLSVIGLLSRGHILIEDVPGVGKTMLARSLARSLGASFGRIQFTPDLLPSDVTGVSVYNQATRDFEFQPGPVMSQIVLVDEINRATPKTQSALLEAMEERQITVDGVSYPLPRPFMVLATQNPIEYEGTFSLPEAQLDRFLMRIHLGYPEMRDEIEVLDRQRYHHPVEDLDEVVSAEDLIEAQEAIKSIYIAPAVKEYIVRVVQHTRQHPDVYLGASPRGSLTLYRTAQARSSMLGREYALPDDVKFIAPYVLSHRLIVSPSARLRNVEPIEIVSGILEEVPMPEPERGRPTAERQTTTAS
jgi:MoxR-like ATPase